MKKINKKGFTLIELLAVIVILGVIMVIAVPAVTKYIDKSRKDGVESSAKMYVDAVNKMSSAGELTTENGSLAVKDLDVQLKSGQKPSNGWLDINDGIVERATLCIDKYSIKYENKNAKIVNDDYCNYEVTFEGNKTEVTGTTMVINKTLTTETNIMCTNGAIPSYSDGKINVTHVNGKTKCGVYDTLQEGIDNTDTSLSNIVMINDEISDNNIINENKNIILDLNGRIIKSELSESTETTSNENGRIINLYGNLIINDSVGTGKIYTGIPSSAIVLMNGLLIINGGSYNGRQAVYVKNGKLIINGGNFNSKYYSTITLDQLLKTSEIIINGGNFSAIGTNYIVWHNAENQIITINGGNFNGQNYLIYNNGMGTININGGNFTSSNGHVIYNKIGKLNITNAIVNATKTDGVGNTCVYNYKGDTTISGGTFHAIRDISVYNSQGNLTITGGKFLSEGHGTIFHDAGTTYISGTPIITSYNKSVIVARGGNLYINGGTYNSTNSIVTMSAYEEWSGGNVYICDGEFNVNNLQLNDETGYIYYKSGLNWNGNTSPTKSGTYVSNVILDNTITCK